jgi:hypothetical protein
MQQFQCLLFFEKDAEFVWDRVPKNEAAHKWQLCDLKSL